MSLMQSDWNKKRNYDKKMQLPKMTWNKGGNGNGRWENGE
jgi:hypothetical protein